MNKKCLSFTQSSSHGPMNWVQDEPSRRDLFDAICNADEVIATPACRATMMP